LYGDSAYAHQGELLNTHAAKARDFTNERGYRNAPLSDEQKAKNKSKSAVRAAIEHPFLQIKRIWGYARVRYRGIAKNHNRRITMCALYSIRKADVLWVGLVRLQCAKVRIAERNAREIVTNSPRKLETLHRHR